MKMPLPPVEEQRRTVAKIDNLAAKIKEVRGLRESAMEKADALLPRSRAAEFMVLADHFPNLPLDKLISMASGEGLTSSQMDDAAPYPVYGGGGLTGRYSQYLFEEPKIAIGRVGARCGCVFVTEPKSWITDNALYLTEISADLHPPYLVHALSTLDIRQQANQAAQPVVSQKKINPLTIPVPPIAEQQRIVGELDALQAEISSLRHMQAQTTAELDALLPSILDKAFKGEL
jgi:type I restriction enzyme S subunit